MITNGKTAQAAAHPDPSGDMLTLQEVAQHYKVCTKTIRRLVKRLDIPVMQVGRQIRLPVRYLPLFATKAWGGK